MGASKHGRHNTREYNSWRGMIGRCYAPRIDRTTKGYRDRGIQVCDRWRQSFADFYADMGPTPSPSHTIERLNNDGNYEPGNCIWATQKTQARNRRTTRLVTVNGRRVSLAEAAEITGLSRATIHCRLKRGWTDAVATTRPQRRYRHV